MTKEILVSNILKLHLKLCLYPTQLWSNEDFVPQNYGAKHTLPRKMKEPSDFATQYHRAFILYPAKLWRSADFAPQNHRDIVSGVKI